MPDDASRQLDLTVEHVPATGQQQEIAEDALYILESWLLRRHRGGQDDGQETAGNSLDSEPKMGLSVRAR